MFLPDVSIELVSPTEGGLTLRTVVADSRVSGQVTGEMLLVLDRFLTVITPELINILLLLLFFTVSEGVFILLQSIFLFNFDLHIGVLRIILSLVRVSVVEGDMSLNSSNTPEAELTDVTGMFL